MDLGTTQHVAKMLSDDGKVYAHGNDDATYTVCSLSGMSTSMDVERYRQAGVGMCLIGESLMRATDPQQAIRDLCLDPADYEKQQASGGGAGGAYTRGTQLIKVCGITNSDDALVACQSGANLIGVIFAPKSKRCVSVEQAKSVVETVRVFGERSKTMQVGSPSQQLQPLAHLVSMTQQLEDAGRRPMVVGVFQNQDPEFIKSMVEECGLDMVQLHGKEGMEACSTTGVPTIRVVDVETDAETGKASSSAVNDVLQSLTSDPAAILLDTSIKGAKEGGGTGVTFDWSIAEKIQNAGLPVIIAGGLTPDNVKDAVTSTRPWGVDVSSGVEATPGTKDHDKVKAFVKGAKEAALESSKGF
jgi:anthranilate synthase/indole-3-glycerol phosphate synthase/phosphoribosylanthranilate isomerase